MLSPDSNRNDPRFVEYYQTLADIIGIFWQFHKERVESGNIEFTYMKEFQYPGYNFIPFDPQVKANKYPTLKEKYLGGLLYKNISTYNVVENFGMETSSTLIASWMQFLEGVGTIDHLPNFLNGMPEPPESLQRFMSPYARSLIDKAGDLGKDLSKVELTNKYEVGAVVSAGMNTGTKVTTQLRALFDEDFKTIMPVILSKVRLGDIEEARTEIGIKSSRSVNTGDANYNLLDNSKYGLDVERLKEFGLGDTLGCPASMKVSEPAKQFLKECGVEVSGTMLEDFAGVASEKFEHYVGSWYRDLSPREQRKLVEPETRKILDGDVLKEARQKSQTKLECPYRSGSRERM